MQYILLNKNKTSGEDKMSDIFLSYKSEDREKAHKIAVAIEKNGYSVWWDRIIPPGRLSYDVIEEELKSASCVVVLWSNKSVESLNVKTEANEGYNRRIVIPVLIENVKQPFAFRLLKAANLEKWDGSSSHHEFQLLLESIRRILGYPQPAETDILNKLIYEYMQERMDKLPFYRWEIIQEYIVKNFESSINKALKGEIYVSPGEYYDDIYSEIDKITTTTEVFAVATLSSQFWKSNPEQQDYLKKNLKAAEHCRNMRRLFILPDEQWELIGSILKKQIDKGIEIRRAPQDILGKYFIEDMVIFKDTLSNESRAYVAELTINSSRIRRGRLILDDEKINELIDTFEKAWAISTEINSNNIQKISSVKKLSKLPSEYLEEYKLDKPVVTCKEAAQAKGIPLENELKTLVLQTSNGFVAIELPGDATASLRNIKDALEVKEAYLAGPETLAKLGLEPGTVSAVSAPVWDMPHLISKRLMNLNEVSTNSHNKKGYYRFEPSLLLKAKEVMIGDFEEEYMDE